MRRLALIASLILFVGLNAMFAQTTTITGLVTDSESGEPMPGVSVVVRGTTIGTVTNVDGNYTLSVPDDATNLLFSFVGMKTQDVVIGGRTTINVVLESEAIGVDEVVVTALGVSREKKSLGYASQSVKADDLTAANNTNAVSALAGKVAGVQISGSNFAGSQNVLIRGASSLTGNNQPLYVVDGVPLDASNFNSTGAQTGGGGIDYGSMSNDLNPADIESINILKGSAATAQYGSRGQNGVIMITTKTGKAGKKTFAVDVNSGISWEKVNVIPQQQKKYGGGLGDFRTETIDGNDYEVVLYRMDESWGPKYDPNREVIHWWGAADYEKGITTTPETAPWVYPEENYEDYYETGVAYTNSVSIRATTEKSALRFGYTNVNMTGTMPNSSQDKHTFNINGSTELWDGFAEVNANMTYVYTYTKGRPEGGYGDKSVSQKFFQWGQTQLDMSRLRNYKNPDGTQRTWNRRSFSNGTPVYSDNPYWIAYESYSDDDRERVFGTTGMKFHLTDYLTAEGNVFLDTYAFNIRDRMAVGSQAQSYFYKADRQRTELNLEGRLNFTKKINDFNILSYVGVNRRKEHYQSLIGETDGGLVIPGLYDLNNSVNTPAVRDYLEKKMVNSWFAFASFGWKDMVYLDASIRQDFDTSLPTNDNIYTYPSVSLSYILSESLNLPWLNMAKIRANYAGVGNGTDPYRVKTLFETGQPFNGSPIFTLPATLNNPELKAESTSEYEIGFEASAFNNRIFVDFSYYNRATKDQIVALELSTTTGYGSKYINAGKIENSGVELVLSGTPYITSDFRWDIDFTFAKNDSKVLELPEGIDKIQLARAPFGGAYVNASQGDPYQMLWGYDFVYDDAGNKVIDEGTGFYATSGALTPIGSALPDYNMGIRNSFRFKDFDLAALIDIQKGGNYYSLTNMWAMYSGMDEKTAVATANGNTIREDGLVLDGVIATYDDDGNIVSTRPNDVHISAQDYGAYHYHGFGMPSATSFYDATYIKLREVTLGYTLPQFTDVIKNARVSLYGRNLFVWGLDNDGIDPESTVNGSGNIQGLEGGIIPATRTFGFNVQLTF
ncbi:SusC/RagA family TonB-linked outer membrane protein [Carboxylicivirga sediminis]|uniref:SusC/RagA family TonB-linked outer membrane protein n=1 Tax=Carboxylicivirga sediminis TaxID=2006564 RepID=A0A941F454_9BACT|nr:SusC/RagA family TonB-linked outer membrane protein [Carboxylicivirga sediminis]MBR8535330.1 SusC/RagA family TonB-linked outer membrane protein [Carboxylicivirga sediminis]